MHRIFKTLIKKINKKIVLFFLFTIIIPINQVLSQYRILEIYYNSKIETHTLSISINPNYYKIIIEIIPTIADDILFINLAHEGYYVWSKDRQYLFLYERFRLIPKIHYFKRLNNGVLKVLRCDGYQPGELLYPSLQVIDTVTSTCYYIKFEEIEDFYKKMKK